MWIRPLCRRRSSAKTLVVLLAASWARPGGGLLHLAWRVGPSVPQTSAGIENPHFSATASRACLLISFWKKPLFLLLLLLLLLYPFSSSSSTPFCRPTRVEDIAC